jgi:hypothetical protein
MWQAVARPRRSHSLNDGLLESSSYGGKPMMKPFMLGTALSALMLSSALAQSSMSPPKTNPAPVAPAQSSSKADVDRSQKTDQWLPWSWDTTAIGSDDKNIGDLIPGQNGFVD